MPVPMVRVRRVDVAVRADRVMVPVAVRPGGHERVGVIVVAVVMGVRVFVVQRLVGVGVVVVFGQVQHHAGQHEGAPRGQCQGGATFT